MDKTVRGDGSVISSGVDPAKGGTRRADDRIITSGVQPQTPQVISAGLMDLTGDITLNNNTYRILKPISASGEAEVFLLESDNLRSIFKYYYSNFKPKDSVLDQLKGIHNEDIVDLLDYGYHNGRFFEILEYSEGGSFLEINEKGEYMYIPIRDLEKIKKIVEETVNALHFCHSRNMIHRDIKPGNLFFKNPDGTDILIGDFGISSALDEGVSKRMTGKARTALYAAPELYQSVEGRTIVGKEIDYYAIGISLIHIWAGEEPFKELGELSIMRIKSDGKVHIPDDIPEEIDNLIRGLITVEPQKRWGYEEVQKWLRGEYVPVQVNTVERKYKDFHFGVTDGQDIVVNTSEELAALLEKYPDKGKKHLYKGTIQKWLEDVSQSLYIELRSIVEDEYPTDEDAGLIKAVYTLDPGKSFKTSGGVECKNAVVIGDQIEKEKSYYKTALINNPNADLYMFLEAQGFKKEADTFRNYARLHKNKPEIAINNIILDLHGREKFWHEGKIFHRPEDFLAADDNTKAEIVSMLSDPQSRASIWLEGFHEIKGKQDKFTLAIKEGAEEAFKKIISSFDRNLDPKDKTLRIKLVEFFGEIDKLASDGKFLKALLKTSEMDKLVLQARDVIKDYNSISKGVSEIDEFIKKYMSLSQTVEKKFKPDQREVKDIFLAEDATRYKKALDLIKDMRLWISVVQGLEKQWQRKTEEKQRRLEEKRRLEEERREKGLCLTCNDPVGFWRKMIGEIYCKRHNYGGQVESLQSSTGEDLQKFIDVGLRMSIDGIRFSKDSKGIITDFETGLQWFVGHDGSWSKEGAQSFVKGLRVGGGGWEMPTREELKSIYFKWLGDRNMPPAFKTTGWIVWSGDSDMRWLKVKHFNFEEGRDGSFHRDEYSRPSSRGRAFECVPEEDDG